MSIIVTQQRVFDYLSDNPGATPVQVADGLDASIDQVKARLLVLFTKGRIDRVMEKARVDSMFYFPKHLG